ncbi:MAG TPA: lipid II flippase MurJ [Mycobacteriales bacterium]|nr:lipid II flippase MurJ [Mycobacteriales bacterium]
MSAPTAHPETSAAPGIARAALVIAAVTTAARLAGFARVVVFARIVGPSCLGDTYVTANTVPNIIFDIVAGGALSSLVVPVLAGPAAAGARDVVDRTTSALLTWAVSILVPIMVVGLLLTHPLVRVLVGHGHHGCTANSEVAIGARMLAVFMPQVVLYGAAVVLIGVLQAHRRFVGPALGPLVSSLVVIAAYVVFGAVAAHEETRLATLTRGHELILSLGTTLGVAALLLTLVVPAVRLGIRLRPTYRFPPGVGATIRAMALSGAVVVGSSDLATAVVLRLTNSRGVDGSVVLYNLAWTVFTVPWAVAAVPLATSAFPGLTATWQSGDRAAYTSTAARTARAMLVVVAATAAVMGAAAGPVARVVVLDAPGHVAPTILARGLATFAPGLLGYALVALMSRALYAQGNARTPATAVLGGWLVAVVVDIALAEAMPPGWTVAAVGIGTTVGVTVSGLWLLLALRRSAGSAALSGLAKAATAAVAGGLAGAGGGVLLARAAPVKGVAGDLAVIIGVAAIALAVHALVVAVIDRPTLRMIAARAGLRRA